MTAITTRVLDTSTGRPAGGVPVSLQREVSDGEWTEIGQAITGSDGRAHGLSDEAATGPGRYCLVVRHRHIPLLLSPYGYTVYKGS